MPEEDGESEFAVTKAELPTKEASKLSLLPKESPVKRAPSATAKARVPKRKIIPKINSKKEVKKEMSPNDFSELASPTISADLFDLIDTSKGSDGDAVKVSVFSASSSTGAAQLILAEEFNVSLL